MRVGFLGTGLIAWAHSMALAAMAEGGVIDVAITSCFDIDSGRAERFAAACGCRVACNPDDVVQASDAVWVCTSTAAHRDLVGLACAAGRPLFCEKPLGRNLQEAQEIAGMVERAGVASQVGLVLRTCPVFTELRSAVASGRHGRLMAVQLRDDQFFPISGHYGSTWRGDVTQSGGGTVIEHSVHDLDILDFCAGTITSVSARTANFAGHPGVEDAAVCTLGFHSGASGSLTSVWHRIASRPSTRRLEAIFEDAIVTVDTDFVGPVRVLTDSGEEIRDCEPAGWVRDLPLPEGGAGLGIRMYAAENRSFVDAVVDGRTPSPSVPDGLVAHRLVEAVYRSAAAGGASVDPRTL